MRTPAHSIFLYSLRILLAAMVLLPAWLLGQDPRTVTAPGEVSVCTRLLARRRSDDTARIQKALWRCLPGQAVELSRGGGDTFFSRPLVLPREVALFVDGGVTLDASTNPRAYDLTPGSCSHAHAAAPDHGVDAGNGCKPFLLSYQATWSAVLGDGTVDGPNRAQGKGMAAWAEALSQTGAANAPDLIEANESNDFLLAGVHLRHAARHDAYILKGTGFTAWGVTAEDAGGYGIALNSTREATITQSSFHNHGRDVYVGAERWIFPSAEITIAGNRLDGGHAVDLEAGAPGGIKRLQLQTDAAGQPDAPAFHVQLAPQPAQRKARVVVAADGSADVTSVQAAVDELPDDGGTVVLRPGTYREVVTVRKPHVRFEGAGSDASQVVIVFGNYAGKVGGTFNSATVFVEADDFFAENLTIANDYNPLVHPHEGGQAVALAVTADRAVFRHVRLLGRQDTLFANSRYCFSDAGPCNTTRQYFADCYIEGNVDFIFGDSRAVFDHCTLHGLAGNVMYTAQDKRYPDEPSGYVFNHCTLTADAGAKRIALGRPWRRYATVVYLHSDIESAVIPAGWVEWPHDGKPSLPTAYYAEFDSSGPGASPGTRESYAKQLTAKQAAAFATARFLVGWNPEKVR